MTEEVSSTIVSTPIDESEIEQSEDLKSDDTSIIKETNTIEESEVDKEKIEIHEPTAVEKLVHETAIITPTPPAHPIFAPLNIPLYRRRQTLTILIWCIVPWFCLLLSFFLLRSHNWYIVGAFIAYLTWMTFMQKFPREGGIKQEWFRRLQFWKWGAGKCTIHLLFRKK